MDEVERAFREESGKARATLIRFLGDIDLAEEAVQDAFLTAMQRWPGEGVPPSPAGWIITTARNRAIDVLRREGKRREKYLSVAPLTEEAMPEPDLETMRDDQLRLVFTCCHPSLAIEAQMALTLRLIGGLETAEIARAFLVPEATMAQRLVRAKKKIKANNIPYRVPDDSELPDRLPAVLGVLYLIFNEGHTTTSGDGLWREDLSAEAIRLTRETLRLMPDEPEVSGLLALMLLVDSRRAARLDVEGSLVLLADQDRSLWNSELMGEGQDLVRACLRRNRPGPYQIQAAINAVHSDANDAGDTKWDQIVALYDQLMSISPTDVVALNRAAAIAELDGPESGLHLIDGLDLDGYQPFHAARAEMLRRLGRDPEALAAYRRALSLTSNRAEREFLAGRINSVSGAG